MLTVEVNGKDFVLASSLDYLYGVSEDGQVYSVRKRKVLAPRFDKDGYQDITFSINKARKTIRVHRLVAEVYLRNYKGYPVVNHKNGIKSDNRADNLEWCTVSQNTKHAFEHLGRVAHHARRFTITRSGALIDECVSVRSLAAKYKVNVGYLSQVHAFNLSRRLQDVNLRFINLIPEYGRGHIICRITALFNGNVIRVFGSSKECAAFFNRQAHSLQIHYNKQNHISEYTIMETTARLTTIETTAA